MSRRAASVLAPGPRWVRRVVREVLAAHPRPPHDAPRELAALVALLIARLPPTGPRVVRRITTHSAMGRRRFGVPEIPDVGVLAERLELDPGQLAWLADVRGLERSTRSMALRNYRYHLVPRASGPARVVEAPKRRLKEIQRALLHDVLALVPAHPAAHGFVPGRSARTHAELHSGRRVVIGLDLRDFFAGIAAGRVWATFRALGYPEEVAHLLTGLCTNRLPSAVWAHLEPPADPAGIAHHNRLGRRLAAAHLPQGAPTSPALANLAAHRLDRRLGGLAARFGAQYSRYADDLTFSGDRQLQRAATRLCEHAAAIVRDEGFVLHGEKSHLTTRAGAQRVCGITVNDHPNLPRDEHDRLRAQLHRLSKDGPTDLSADSQARLQGRVAWATHLNPARGARLQQQLEQIQWR
jgi:RNA-directed DNA polymerase